MRQHDSYYSEHELPSPARVIAAIDFMAKVAKPGSTVIARLLGNSVALDEDDLNAVRDSLRALQRVFETSVIESDAERIRIRLALSEAEALVRRKLGRHARRVEKVEHLNSSSGLDLRSLNELVGTGWPGVEASE